MQGKHKVTLYLPNDLHRQLKIRSAVDGEAMSAMAERAIGFYLTHSDIVEGTADTCGQTHRVYDCPECSTAVVLREGELAAVSTHSNSCRVDDLTLGEMPIAPDSLSRDEGELVPC
ncbi:hypothetical protein IQ241_05955 [Romeria aff. gracilis LEGE 07310]|uniref:Uncharacterized protein n=1 Tax=Vasconcelosia minhoensis LEGE 07310 TaxID=915328 RepID=A0A8J7AW50_9CYAN|nr:hypothetical protein [Romeria gracilis]MBE9076842.1 hypothetical protein [Romeria aff. gracilis LEGE 07310]